jgi:hypothetical protein
VHDLPDDAIARALGTSSDWQGRRLTTGAKIVDGHLPTPDEQRADLAKLIDRMPSDQRARAREQLANAKFSDQSRMLDDAGSTPRRTCRTSMATARWRRSR